MRNKIICKDVLEGLKELPDNSVNCIITSPPYWGLRDYGVDDQIGLEPSLQEFINKMLMVTKELMRVLRDDGIMFWNHGDSYYNASKWTYKETGHSWDRERELIPRGKRQGEMKQMPEKCLCLQNYRLILRMVDSQGWIIRNTIIWHKPNHMPSSVKDRFANSYEPVFMLVKKKNYWFDLDAVRKPYNPDSIKRACRARESEKLDAGIYAVSYKEENVGYNDINGKLERGELRGVHPLGGNPEDVWKIATQPYSEAHFATFPEKLVMPMIKSGCPKETCKACSKPRTRITKTEFIKTADAKPAMIGDGKRNPAERTDVPPNRGYSEHKTVGWTSCGCKEGFIPGIVLDPFFGSGTVGLVAKKLGRDFVGIDNNPEYCELAKKRLGGWMQQKTLGGGLNEF